MTAVSICSYFGAKKIKPVTASTFSPSICHEVIGLDAMIFVFFWILSFKPALHSPFSPSSRGSSVPLHSLPLEWYHRHIWSCWYFSQQSWFQLVIHPARCFTWCSAYKLNKQGDNTQPCCTPFPIWSQSIVPCMVLTVASWPEYKWFLGRQLRWSAIPTSLRISQFVVIYTVKGFRVVKAQVDVFLEFPCILYDPTDIVNLIPNSSAFSKPNL